MHVDRAMATDPPPRSASTTGFAHTMRHCQPQSEESRTHTHTQALTAPDESERSASACTARTNACHSGGTVFDAIGWLQVGCYCLG
jgi:hypothetical protein